MRLAADFTPQEVECIRIALDHYEAEMDEVADAIEPGADAHDTDAIVTYRAEAQVARTTRAKVW